MGGIKAIVLCGGPSKGTRFRPLSMDLPKPLFPVAGRPMILHHLEAITQLPGLQEVVLMGFYEESLFQSFLHSTSARFDVQIRYLQESGEMGTAGGLFEHADTILEGEPDHVFVLHCDVCCTFPLAGMLDFHTAHAGSATILGKRMPAMQAVNYGCIVSAGDSKQVQHYAEKPETFVSDIINCGVYLFDAAVMVDMQQKAKSRPSTPVRRLSANFQFLKRQDGKAASLEQDVLIPLSTSGNLFLYETQEFWNQIKEPGAALESSRSYMQWYHKSHPELLAADADRRGNLLGDVVVHDTAEVHPTAKIGPNVAIGAGAYIGPGVRIVNSIILEGVQVMDHACILSSIIGWNSTVGEWTRVEGVADGAARMGPFTIFGVGVTADPEIIVRNSIVLPHKRLTHSYKNAILL